MRPSRRGGKVEMMNFGTRRSHRRPWRVLLAVSVIVGLAACAESTSKDTASSETVVQPKIKNAALTNCTFATTCAVGMKGVSGGDVFLGTSNDFACGASLRELCNFGEVAPPEWAFVPMTEASSTFAQYCTVGSNIVDVTCQWSRSANEGIFDGPTRFGFSGYNAYSYSRTPHPIYAFTRLYKPVAEDPDRYTPFVPPTLDELIAMCNYANNQPISTTSCKPGTLRSDFKRDWYWSSSVRTGSWGVRIAYAVHFGTGAIAAHSRTTSHYIRPIRLFKSNVDTTFTTTTTTTTLPPTTVPRSTIPPRTSVPATTVAPTTTSTSTTTTTTTTTLPPTTVPTCASGGVCKLGETGPGGGKVFFVGATSFACGPNLDKQCKYLEFAPLNWRTTPVSGCVLGEANDFLACPWPTAASGERPETSKALGTGAKNTAAMYALAPTPGLAAVRAYNGGGKTDWFLASEREANELCKWAHAPFRGPTPGDPNVECRAISFSLMFSGLMPMWTSTDVSADQASTMQVLNANPQMSVGEKSAIGLFWPIRAF